MKMNRTNVQAFAFGIALTTLTFYVYSLFAQPNANHQTIEELEKKDYKVLTAGEYESLQEQLNILTEENSEIKKQLNSSRETDSKTDEDSKKVEEKPTDSNQDGNVDGKEEVKTVTLTITEGMVLENIATELSNSGIIKDRNTFINYFLDNDLDRGIQLGSYKINSNMSFQDIASLITR